MTPEAHASRLRPDATTLPFAGAKSTIPEEMPQIVLKRLTTSTETGCGSNSVIFTTSRPRGCMQRVGANGTVIERCLVKDCGIAGILLGFDTSPEFFDTVVNPDYYKNNGDVHKSDL